MWISRQGMLIRGVPGGFSGDFMRAVLLCCQNVMFSDKYYVCCDADLAAKCRGVNKTDWTHSFGEAVLIKFPKSFHVLLACNLLFITGTYPSQINFELFVFFSFFFWGGQCCLPFCVSNKLPEVKFSVLGLTQRRGHNIWFQFLLFKYWFF